MRVLRSLALPICCVVLVSAWSWAPAAADPPESIGPPDKSSHSWCYTSGFTMTTVADASMARLESQTVVKTVRRACGPSIDVRWTQGKVPGAYGSAQCRVRWSGGACDRFRITLNKSVLNSSPHPVSQRRKTSCHEVGHTVGVRHYFGSNRPGGDTAHSCLWSGTVPSADKPWHTRYGGHHRRVHINPHFR